MPQLASGSTKSEADFSRKEAAWIWELEIFTNDIWIKSKIVYLDSSDWLKNNLQVTAICIFSEGWRQIAQLEPTYQRKLKSQSKSFSWNMAPSQLRGSYPFYDKDQLQEKHHFIKIQSSFVWYAHSYITFNIQR